MQTKVLITGGARSGKSLFAEKMTLKLSQKPVYIATCEVFDDDMQKRVDIHRARRGSQWRDYHAPLNLAQALIETDGSARLVDCLTLWANNLLYHEHDWKGALNDLQSALEQQSAPVIFVTNEIGMGGIPENSLARRFLDVAGEVNQVIASCVNEMHLLVSGQSIRVK